MYVLSFNRKVRMCDILILATLNFTTTEIRTTDLRIMSLPLINPHVSMWILCVMDVFLKSAYLNTKL